MAATAGWLLYRPESTVIRKVGSCCVGGWVGAKERRGAGGPRRGVGGGGGGQGCYVPSQVPQQQLLGLQQTQRIQGLPQTTQLQHQQEQE